MSHTFQPTVLCILDGFGVAKPSKANAVTRAKMPVYTALWKKYPHTVLQASGKYVGLPPRQAGNSEAGHMNIGAGRVVQQDAVRISQSIVDGTFFKNSAFLGAVKHIKRYGSHLHLMGLLCDDQSAHAYPEHLQALLEFYRRHGVDRIFLHLFTDGRDSPPYVAIKLLRKLKRTFKNGEIVATIMGRFYAMDRKKAWARTAAAYNAIVLGQGYRVDNSEDAILHAYGRKESDEFIPPSVVYYQGKAGGIVRDNDALIFFNLRSDRARQLCKPFVQKDFEERGGWRRKKVLENLYFVALTDFGPDLDMVMTAYLSINLIGTLPMALSSRRQLYIAEAEKYAHVTYFINGGYADPVAGEDRIRVPSVAVDHYETRPAMSARQITRAVLTSLKQRRHQFITLNFANPDVLAHSGDMAATIKGLAVVDECLGQIWSAVHQHNGRLIVTADHGNCDAMLDAKTGEIITEHSQAPVPFLLASEDWRRRRLRSRGCLANIAPTILEIMQVKQPRQMKGKSLIH
ncbi:2,3-bisphosphoglycerate-independent phosphoglycerate mutase [Candidatus Falkowbacteria bacterium]|nr:2,3-bisphosphoglycerate-independent phosphoglycerate mutase [Candidatus Falkowbacteria bacterium]